MIESYNNRRYKFSITKQRGCHMILLWVKFDFHRAAHRNIISIVKPTRCTNVLFYFGMTVHVSDGLSVHHQEFKTVHTETDICQTDTAVCTVLNSRWWTERPSETCRVSFQNKINLIHWCILSVLQRHSEPVISTLRPQIYFRRAQLRNTLGAGLKVTPDGTYSYQCATGD